MCLQRKSYLRVAHRCRVSWVVWPLEHRLSYLAYLLLSSEPVWITGSTSLIGETTLQAVLCLLQLTLLAVLCLLQLTLLGPWSSHRCRDTCIPFCTRCTCTCAFSRAKGACAANCLRGGAGQQLLQSPRQFRHYKWRETPVIGMTSIHSESSCTPSHEPLDRFPTGASMIALYI
jgi:hypothetical protein